MRKTSKFWSIIGLGLASIAMVFAALGGVASMGNAVETRAEAATMTAGTNAESATVNDKTAIKVGTNKKSGDMSITVGAGATKLSFYAAAWKGVTNLSLNLTIGSSSVGSVSLTADDGISNSSPFTLKGTESDFLKEVSLSNITASTTIKLTSSSAKRFVVWGASYETSGGDTPADPSTIPVTGVSLDKSTTTIDVRATETLTATISPSDATNQNVTWSSDNEEVATVVDGVVTGVAAGDTTITVTTEDGNKTATCDVTVKNVAVMGVSLTESATTVDEGATVTLTATVSPDNATNKNVTWGTSNPDVATVSGGTVTGVSVGTATITVTTIEGSFTDTCEVTVNAFTGYRRVTDASALQPGDRLIIAKANDTSPDGTAMSMTQNTNNRGQVSVTQFGSSSSYDKINSPSPKNSVQIVTLESADPKDINGVSTPLWHFNVGTNAYLYAASSSSNYLRTTTKEAAGDNGKWLVSISSGVASIIAQGTYTNNVMQYNQSSSIFSCYGSASQTDVSLFRMAASSMSVKTNPTKQSYHPGDNFDPAGLVITMTYPDASTLDVPYNNDTKDLFSFDPSESLDISDDSVTVTYLGKTATISISVDYASPTALTLAVNGEETTSMELLCVAEGLELSAIVSPSGTKQDVTWSLVSAVKDNEENYAAGPSNDYELLDGGIDTPGALFDVHTTYSGTIVLRATSVVDANVAEDLTFTIDATPEVVLNPTSIVIEAGESAKDEYYIEANTTNFAGTVSYEWELITESENIEFDPVPSSSDAAVIIVILDTTVETEATIRVTAQYSNQTDSCDCSFKLTLPQVTSITLDHTAATIWDGSYDKSVDLTATVVSVGGVSEALTWSIDSSSASGLVSLSSTSGDSITVSSTGVGSGTATIKVVSDYNVAHDITGVEATCEITISHDAVKSINWTSRGNYSIYAGTTIQDILSKTNYSFAVNWNSGRVQTTGDLVDPAPTVGTGLNDIHLALYSTSTVSKGSPEATPLPLTYPFAESDTGLYLIAYYGGVFSSTNIVSRLTVIPTLNPITSTASGEPTDVCWQASSSDPIGTASSGSLATDSTQTSFSYVRSNNGIHTYNGGTANYWQIGKSSYPDTLLIRSDDFDGIVTSVAVECASKSGSTVLKISVGGDVYYEGATPAYSDNDSLSCPTAIGNSSGEIVIDFSAGKGALYIRSVTVTVLGVVVRNYENQNFNAQKTVTEFASFLNEKMGNSETGVCRAAFADPDNPLPVDAGSSEFGSAWADISEEFNRLFGAKVVDAVTVYGVYNLSKTDYEHAMNMFLYGKGTWEDYEEESVLYTRDLLQRALMTYDFVTQKYADELETYFKENEIEYDWAFLPEGRDNPLVGLMFSSHPFKESSPLTTTLWIVLGCGLAGLGAIGTAYFISKKKREQSQI